MSNRYISTRRPGRGNFNVDKLETCWGGGGGEIMKASPTTVGLGVEGCEPGT